MGNGNQVVTSIVKVEGGYIVDINGQTQVTTSLQKAIGFIRDALKGEADAE